MAKPAILAQALDKAKVDAAAVQESCCEQGFIRTGAFLRDMKASSLDANGGFGRGMLSSLGCAFGKNCSVQDMPIPEDCLSC